MSNRATQARPLWPLDRTLCEKQISSGYSTRVVRFLSVSINPQYVVAFCEYTIGRSPAILILDKVCRCESPVAIPNITNSRGPRSSLGPDRLDDTEFERAVTGSWTPMSQRAPTAFWKIRLHPQLFSSPGNELICAEALIAHKDILTITFVFPVLLYCLVQHKPHSNPATPSAIHLRLFLRR